MKIELRAKIPFQEKKLQKISKSILQGVLKMIQTFALKHELESSLPNKLLITFEPPCDKTNKMACAPSEDSDQPGHPPRLIRVIAVHMKKAWVLSYPLSTQRRL